MKELSDKEIILKIKNGEIDYFTRIVEKYTQKIYQLIKSRLTFKEDAEDLTQNTFINFYKAIERFDEAKPVLPYLYQIARNELKMFFRSRNKTISLDEKILLVDDRIITKLEKDDFNVGRWLFLSGDCPKIQKTIFHLFFLSFRNFYWRFY